MVIFYTAILIQNVDLQYFLYKEKKIVVVFLHCAGKVKFAYKSKNGQKTDGHDTQHYRSNDMGSFCLNQRLCILKFHHGLHDFFATVYPVN